MSETLVIYHSPCNDGWCAAWLIDRLLGGVQLYPANYGADPPPVKRRNVIVVDFSYPRDVMERMASEANSLVVLDHHKTAEADCKGLPFCTFDMSKSGARLAWEYLWPMETWKRLDRQLCSGMEALVAYTQDRDLYKHVLPDTRAINAAIRSYPWDLKVWDELAIVMAGNIGQIKIEGQAIERYRSQQVDIHVNHAERITVAGYPVPAVQITVPDITSDVLHELSKGQPFAISYINANGALHCSLRSDHNGLDVSEIAKSFGGGGHKHASGFKIPARHLAEIEKAGVFWK